MKLSHRIASCAVLFAFLLTPVSLYAQEPDYHSDPHFQKKWAEAQDIEKKHQRDLTAAAYRKANEAAKGQCEDCLLQSMKFDSLAKNYKQVLKTAAEAEALRGISRHGLSETYVFEADALIPDLSSAGSDQLAKAHALYLKAIESDDKYIMAYWGDGQALAMMNQTTEAVDRFHWVASHALSPGFRDRAVRYQENPALAGASVAPSFHFATLDGKVITSDELRGRVVLLVFFNRRGTNNVKGHHYQQSIPHIQDVLLRHKSDPFAIITIYFGNNAEDATLFSNKNPAPWPQVADPAGKIAGSFHVTHIPTYILMGPEGEILATETQGDFNLSDKIDRLLRQLKDKPTTTASAK